MHCIATPLPRVGIPYFYISFIMIFLLSLFIVKSTFSQNRNSFSSNKNTEAKVKLISSNIENSVIEFNFDGFKFKDVNTGNKTDNTLVLGNSTPMLIAGAPDLLKLTSSVIIPDKAKMKIKVEEALYKEYSNIDIAPSKGNLTRDIDPSTVPFDYGKVYQKDMFYPGKLADIRNPYIFRDYRGQTIITYPFQYNPVTKVLRVYYKIKVKIFSTDGNAKNAFNRKKPLTHIDEEYKNAYSNHFINYSSFKYTPLNEYGNMLIISHSAFKSEMNPFVEWKNKIGIPTELVDIASIGTTAAAIKTFVNTYYQTNGLTYLLLVGDASFIPTNSLTSGHSDNAYGYISGNDSYPEIMVGRFSCETAAHAQTMVQRSIDYEFMPLNTPNWYNKCLGIASEEGPGDDGELDYEHIRNMNTDLLNFTYSYCGEYFEGSQGGNDAVGNPPTSIISAGINAGAGLILYTGHGSTTSWGTSGFSNSNVNSLTNTGMLPIIWSVACVNGNFVGNTCFAEAWTRATHNGQPAGAVATLMSTINQSWNPPMEAQDEMVDIMVESDSNNIKRSFGGLSMSGCMKMNDTYGTSGDPMTDTWNLFGDPSLMVRTDTPTVMTVSHPPTVQIGVTQLVVNCNTDSARIALTIDNQIIGVGTVSGGIATINFNALSNIDTIVVAVTAFNKYPYIGLVNVIAASGPFVNFQNNQINDQAGNNNSQADYGENILLNIELKNSGVDAADSVYAILSTNDTYITITDNAELWGNIASSNSATKNNAYAFQISNSIPDNHSVNFALQIHDKNGNSWSSNFSINVGAPSLFVESFIIDDNIGGNNNGILDPGETAIITIVNKNNGLADAVNSFGNISSGNPLVTISNSVFNIGSINNDSSKNATFQVNVDASAQIGSSAVFDYSVTCGSYSAQKQFSERIGIIYENFEPDFTQPDWSHSGNTLWFVTDLVSYEGNNSARSGAISDSEQSIMTINKDIAINDSISFYLKVSCEEGSANSSWWDYLEFFIDGVSQEKWDGEKDWMRVAYYVSAGNHDFKWIYTKDYTASDGDDAAWVDYIVFPPIGFSVDVENVDEIAFSFNVYPNPVKDYVNIEYNLDKKYNVKLSICDFLGREIELITDGIVQAGRITHKFDAGTFNSGMYYCILSVDNQVYVKKIVLLE